jgi:hypothetical protein
MLGVTARSVYRWLDPEQTHPCNQNLDKLLDLALEKNPNNTFQLLTAEASDFWGLIDERRRMSMQNQAISPLPQQSR